jgi:predicted CXXCH cytochrome family protein
MVDVPKVGTTGEDPDDRVVRPIVMSTGSHHQQLYWYPLPNADKAPDAVAEAIYATRCASCHGDDGVGGEAPALTGREHMEGFIRTAMKASTHRHLVNPPLSDEELDKMVRFVLRMQFIDRLMQFPFSWIVADDRWVHEDYTFLGPPYDPSVKEPYDQGWSNACDGCHAVEARFETPDPGRLGRASVVELGISCEVCHGPARNHVLRHKNPLARYRAHNEDIEDDIVNPVDLSPSRGAAVCGQCHGETIDKQDDPVGRFRPGDRLEDHVHVVRMMPRPYPDWLASAIASEEDLLESGFWQDGTMRVAGRDYNALIETGCHTEGELTCTTCHQMHGPDPNDQLKPEAKSNEVCAKCHASVASDLSAHTHHAPDSPGSLCYNCHMPHTTWGLLGAMRAHRVTSPNASVALTTGRPNACNLCHLDWPFEKTAKTLSAWYGQPPPPGPQPPELHMPKDVSAAAVWVLRGNGVQRAVAAWHFGWDTAMQTSDSWWAPAFLARALNDPYPAVRYVAHKSLTKYAGYQDFGFDYAADADALYAERLRALSLWKPRSEAVPAALFVESGSLDYGRIEALEILRDTRPVSVNE